MRRTMRKKVTNTGKDRLYTIFAFFIVAPIISIVLAFALVQNVILPRLEEGENTISTIEEGLGGIEENNYELDDDFNLNEDSRDLESAPSELTDKDADSGEDNTVATVFYGVQIGNFSSIANADTFINELKGNNINNGYIVKVGDSYKVFAGEFQIKEEAYSYLESIREAYEDAFVNTVSSKDKITKSE